MRFIVVETASPDTFLAAVADRPDVRYIEPDGRVAGLDVAPTIDDPRLDEQYALPQIRAPESWATTLGQAANLCILDSGVRYTHEDLAGPRWLGGIDLVNDDADPMDDHGHGTHVTGIAAASLANALGMAGVSQAGFYAVKVLDSNNGGTWSNIALGIEWCADNTPDHTIINLSLGGAPAPSAISDAVAYARAAGKVLVAAAGNEGNFGVLWPAAHPDVIAVACNTSSSSRCTDSSRGPQLDLAAPGSGILSLGTTDSGYSTLTGTSMSAPHVSGVAALVWSARPTLTVPQLEHRLLATAQDLGAAGHDTSFGHGRVDAVCALTCPLPPPGAPVALQATRTAIIDGVRLDWNAPTDAFSRFVAGYNVYRGEDLGGPYDLIATTGPVPGYTDTTVGTIVSHAYVVSAFHSESEGLPSNEACSGPLPLSEVDRTCVFVPGGLRP